MPMQDNESESAAATSSTETNSNEAEGEVLPDDIREQLLDHYDKVAKDTHQQVEVNTEELQAAVSVGGGPVALEVDPNEIVPITDENFLASLASEVGLGTTGYTRLEHAIRDNIDEFVGDVDLEDPEVVLEFIINVPLDTPLVDINSPALRNIAFVHSDTAWQVKDVSYLPAPFAHEEKQLWVELKLFSLADL